MAEEEVPITPSLWSSVLLSEGGEIREDYETCYISFETEGVVGECPVIPITVVQRRLLVAVPFGAWSEQASERFLPRTALTKAVLVEVEGVVFDEFGGQSESQPCKAWVGFLRGDLARSGQVGELEEPGTLDFGEESDMKVVPFARVLVDLANEHFTFFSARSGNGEGGEVEEEVAVGQLQNKMDARFAKLEESMAGLQAALLSLGGSAGSAAGGALVATGKAKVKKALPGLDAGVVASARQAGIDDDQLQRLSSLLVKPNRMEERPTSSRDKKKTDLSESEEDYAEEMAEDEGEAGGEKAGGPVEQAVVKLTKLMTTLTKEKASRRGLDAILERVDAGGGEGSNSGVGGSKSKSAAYKKLKSALESKPEWLFNNIENLMEEDFNLVRAIRLDRSPRVEPSMGRTSIQAASLPIYYKDSLDNQWNTRCFERRSNKRSSSMMRLSFGGYRPIQPRQWKLDFSSGGAIGSTCSICKLCGSQKPRPGRAGGFKVAGRETCRDPGLATQGEGQLHRKSQEAWRCWEGKDCGPSANQRPEVKGATQVKGERPRARRQCSHARRCGTAGRVKREEDGRGGASGGLKIPGAGASSVHAGIWNLAFSALLRARTDFAAFAHSILSKCAHVQRAPEGVLWPMPLPYPEVHRSAKSRARDFDETKIGLNYVVLALNWLAVGERLVDVSSIRLGTKLTRDQWCAVRRLRPLLSSWNACGTVSASDMGRCAAKVESVETELRKLEEAAQRLSVSQEGYFGPTKDTHAAEGYMGHPGEEVGLLEGGGIEHVAKDVEPDRLFFHGEPSFNPVPFLDWRNRKTYTRPLDFAAELDPEDPMLPKVKMRCAASSRIRVLEKLDQVKRLHLEDAASCRKGFENGLFCIPKDLVRDRMILDARRANACEESEKRWIYSLGSLQQFQHVFLEPEEDARLYAEDLREFYHCFKIGAQRRIRNALAGRYKPEELQHLGAFREELLQCKEIVACLDTMAMGDTNAVAYGQVSHLSILLRLPGLTLQDFVSLRLRPSRKDWVAGLMIDDFLVMQKIKRGAEDEKIKKLVDEVRQAYLAYGLPRHEGKAVEGEERGEFWGAEFDGGAGRIRPSLKKLVPLGSLTLQVVQLGYCTVGLLEVLTGSFIAAFQLRRRLMSCVEEVYGAQRRRARDCIVRLSKQLKDELLVMVSLLPMAVIDMRLQASELLVASDASMNCQAAVCATIGKVRTKELQRHSLQKGLWNRLLSPEASYLKQAGILEEERELPNDSYRMHPVWEEVVSCCRFRQFGRIRRSKKKQHINLSEVQASLDAEKLVGKLQPSSYYIHLQDSQVSLACLVKGRSSSASINKLLRRSVPDYLASNVRPYFGYVRTKLNPADDPTRSAAIREPAREHADWWREIGEEKFDGFDEFLEEFGCHPLQTAELPHECELWEDAELEDSSAREQRRLRGQKLKEKKEKKGCEVRERERGQRTQSAEAEKEQRLQITEEADQSQGLKDDEPDVQRLRSAEAEEAVKSKKFEASPDELLRGSARQENAGRTMDEREEEVISLLNSFDPEQFVYNKKFSSLQEAIRSGPGLLDLFSGKRGFAKAFVRAGCPWAICFDIKDGEKQNLLETQLQSVLLRLLSLGSFVAMAAGPVCASFSTAITPPWRTREMPRGKEGLTAVQLAKLDVGHRQLKFVPELVAVCIAHSILFWIENPDGSWFWRMDAELSWDERNTAGTECPRL